MVLHSLREKPKQNIFLITDKQYLNIVTTPSAFSSLVARSYVRVYSNGIDFEA